ncbi:conserved hypothetical protein [Pseudomonas sp. OF001]|uniref:hypothetical protein n=1 Tax=unclassified Pseudomonas TaxID=196821 RepID=UPI0010A69837|nr:MULTISPECIES: hypothetical protein [unclassified Pseudomonas]THG87046.1 hypothetical protein E5198_00570 [Pseudomonas sp. A-1]WPP46721.1 hypothetical protein SK095_04830 [Pseudomonas sp. AN-1]CAD5378111.1 conserved hypothetical protein [Pseudomonas sp. OF001]
MNEPQLKNLLDDLDSAKAACDGLSRLVVTRLAEKRIPYRAMLGTVELDGKVISPHIWVEADGCLIDYRAREQLGDDTRLPHGVIARDEVKANYRGQSIVIDPLPDYLFEQLVH